MKIVLTTLNAKYIHSSLALSYLKAFCAPMNANIVIREYTINNELLEIVSDIYRETPKIIGLACYIWNINMILALVKLIKKVLPQTIIILGGPEISFDSEAVMRENPAVDYIIRGEGESTFFSLLTAILNNEPVQHMEGLVQREGDNIVTTGIPQIVEVLDTIPFPYTQEDLLNLKDKIIYYESSRGCPFTCQYCLSSTTRGVRFFNLNRVCHDLEVLIQHNVKQVKFVDRTFNARKEYFFPIWNFLSQQNCRTNFHFEIAAELLDEEILSFLKQVPPGRFQFEIGVQSTNESTLKAIKRHNDWPCIIRNMNQLRSYNNIHLHLDLIVGLPYEGYWRFGKSFNDVYALKPHMLQIGFLKLLKGSGIRQSASLYGYLFSDNTPYEVLANDCLSYEEVRRLKILEKLFNQTYNTGGFSATLTFLTKVHGSDAFQFFHDLSLFFEEKNLHQQAHSGKGMYTILLDFCRTYHSEHLPSCCEFVKFDVLNCGQGLVLQDILPWNNEQWSTEKNNFWRDTAKVRKYLPDFDFTSWRDIKKYYHIEFFRIHIPTFLANPENVIFQQTVLLFDYRSGSIQVIDNEDFR